MQGQYMGGAVGRGGAVGGHDGGCGGFHRLEWEWGGQEEEVPSTDTTDDGRSKPGAPEEGPSAPPPSRTRQGEVLDEWAPV